MNQQNSKKYLFSLLLCTIFLSLAITDVHIVNENTPVSLKEGETMKVVLAVSTLVIPITELTSLIVKPEVGSV